MSTSGDQEKRNSFPRFCVSRFSKCAFKHLFDETQLRAMESVSHLLGSPIFYYLVQWSFGRFCGLPPIDMFHEQLFWLSHYFHLVYFPRRSCNCQILVPFPFSFIPSYVSFAYFHSLTGGKAPVEINFQ